MDVYEIAIITKGNDKAVLKGVEDIVTQFDGKVTNKEEWGERQFGYKIKNLTSGFYHIWNFTIDTLKMKDLKNRLNLNEDIIRYLILKVD